MSTHEPARTISVIFVVGNLRAAGPTMQLLYLISNLDRSLFKPIVLVTTGSPEATEIEDRLKHIGVEVIRLEAGKLASIVVASRALARIARREGQVVVHSYGFRSDIIGWLSGVRPRLANVRNNLRYNFQRRFGHRLGVLVSEITLFFLQRSDLVVCCGTAIRSNLASLGQQAIAIRNAIDAGVCRSLKCTDAGEHRPTSAVPTYVTVGSNIPGKNIEFLVERFAAEPPGTRRLMVIGHADPALIEAHGNNPNVEFCGHVSMSGDALLRAHFFVSASEHEGIPNAVLESLMLGRPVVLSDIPAHREILEAAGPDVGAIFSWTASSFAAALREIERQDYGELSKRCEDSARLSLSASEMARQYQVVYEALVSGSIDDLATEVVTLDADPQRLRGLG